MRVDTHWKIQHSKAFLMLLLCLAVVAAPTLGAADVATAATVGMSPPEIVLFSAQPMVLADGAFAVYNFEVKNATGIKLLEAGETINEFNGPPTGLYKGKANGRTTYQIRKAGMNSFAAILVAVNSGSSQQRSLTLSFASKFQQLDGAQTPPADIPLAKLRKPEWLAQTSLLTPTGPAIGQLVSTYPPPFEKCTKDCDYCLQPDEAAAKGFTQQCSKGPCYYSPDKQQYWYCYSKPVTVWCCLDGKVSEITKDMCYKKGGTAYPTEALALKACDAQGYCCKDGKVGPTLRSRCQEAGGAWYASEKEAIDGCQSLVWCCLNGTPVQTTKEACASRGGTGYATQAEALKYCQQQGYCCINGNVSPAPLQARCLASGGAWFLTEKEAIDACPSNIWCCRDGKVMQTSKELCDQMGGSGYATQAEALNTCQALIWCCLDGNAIQTTRETCYARGGTAYATQAEALKACQAAMACWCCVDGNVFPSNRADCAARGGNCFSTQAEATRYCQQASNCYCCVDGKATQMSTAMCTRYGGRCYSTLAEATKYCQPPVTTCYCCVNGNVSQMTTASCTRYQGTCYSTLDAANKSCIKYIRPPTLYQPPTIK